MVLVLEKGEKLIINTTAEGKHFGTDILEKGEKLIINTTI